MLAMNTKMLFKQSRFLALSIVGLLFVGAVGLGAQVALSQVYPPNQTYQDPQDQNQGQQAPDSDINYNGDPQQDPPSRVARLSYLDGNVSFQPGGQGDWGAATRNRPVTIGDKIWSDNNSRAELQAGQASIHVSSMTALSFLNLDDQTIQMRLAEGTINFRVREMRQGDVYEVDAPNLAFTVTQAGAFRVEVNENGDGTRVTVIRGEGQVVANGQTYTIHGGERGEFNGTENVSYFVASAPAPDDFDRWSNDRDRRDDDSVSAKYVSRDVPGYSDLDDSGTWNEEPDYGPVWYPNTVDVGWAPYSYGSWNYVGPWGWTWVDYSPWGFAPYHYGRWAYIGSRWGWCPGPYYAQPIYGPAFVGFLGGGFNVGFGFGGGIGWFPLGPRECYRPWYRTSGAYYRNVNIHNTYIRNANVFNNRADFNYAYARNSRAVTVASRNNFVGGHAINRGAFHMTDASLRGSRVSNRANFSPTRQSYMGAAANRGNIARPSAAVQNRYVMARLTPGAAASHMPVRTFSGNNNGGNRGNINNSGRGGFNSDRAAMGRAAQMGAAANSNRPGFANGNRGNRNGPDNVNNNNGGFRSDANRPNFGQNRGQNNGQFGGNRDGYRVNNPSMSSRQSELSQDKPQSHLRPGNEAGGSRNWSAQGNITDRGRAPSGFGSDSRNDTSRNSNVIRSDRPSRANGSDGSGRPSGGNNNRSYSAPQRGSGGGYASDRPNYSNGNSRYYNPPQRSSGVSNDRPAYNNGGNRSYPQPNYGNRGSSQPSYGNGNRGNAQPRSYSAPSAPSRSYSAPSRSYSAPSRSYGGGGGSPRSSGGGGVPRSSGGGGSPRGGGGSSSHGGGGGSSHGGGRH
jgi:hypothetical protein